MHVDDILVKTILFQGILSSGLAEIKSRLQAIIQMENTFVRMAENVVLEILDDER